MTVQQAAAMTSYRICRNALLKPPALHPFDRGARAYPEQLGGRPSGRSALYISDHPDTHILRIRSRHSRLPRITRDPENRPSQYRWESRSDSAHSKMALMRLGPREPSAVHERG